MIGLCRPGCYSARKRENTPFSDGRCWKWRDQNGLSSRICCKYENEGWASASCLIFTASNRMLSRPLHEFSMRVYRSGSFWVRESAASRATRIVKGTTSGVAPLMVNGARRSTSSKPGTTTSSTLPRSICRWLSVRVRDRCRSNNCNTAITNAARLAAKCSMLVNSSSPFLASCQTCSKNPTVDGPRHGSHPASGNRRPGK